MLDAKPDIDLVIGTRMRLLGHRIERQPLRDWLGRLFANTASLALGVRVFDTQCGAKLFRATPQTLAIFCRSRFSLAGYSTSRSWPACSSCRSRQRSPLPRETIYEFPLDAWRDVAGSTLKRGDFVKAIVEMARIYWTYLGPAAQPEQSSSAPNVGPFQMPAANPRAAISQPLGSLRAATAEFASRSAPAR